jgi:methylated-DNA-[protein]-cysteine S-methyltransferase
MGISYEIFSIGSSFIGIAGANGVIYCNTIPLKSKEEAERDLIKNCRTAWPDLTLERGSVNCERVAIKIYRIFSGKNEDTSDIILANHNNRKFQEVLSTISLIPWGMFTTYGEIARVTATSPRTVGLYASRNPFPLIVPCHRVVRGDMRVGGYSYGDYLKAQLLIKEGVEVDLSRMRVNPNKLIRASDLKRMREVRSHVNST